MAITSITVGSMRDRAAQLSKLVEQAASSAADGHDVHAAFLLGQIQVIAETINLGAQAAEQELRTRGD